MSADVKCPICLDTVSLGRFLPYQVEGDSRINHEKTHAETFHGVCLWTYIIHSADNCPLCRSRITHVNGLALADVQDLADLIETARRITNLAKRITKCANFPVLHSDFVKELDEIISQRKKSASRFIEDVDSTDAMTACRAHFSIAYIRILDEAHRKLHPPPSPPSPLARIASHLSQTFMDLLPPAARDVIAPPGNVHEVTLIVPALVDVLRLSLYLFRG